MYMTNWMAGCSHFDAHVYTHVCSWFRLVLGIQTLDFVPTTTPYALDLMTSICTRKCTFSMLDMDFYVQLTSRKRRRNCTIGLHIFTDFLDYLGIFTSHLCPPYIFFGSKIFYVYIHFMFGNNVDSSSEFWVGGTLLLCIPQVQLTSHPLDVDFLTSILMSFKSCKSREKDIKHLDYYGF